MIIARQRLDLLLDSDGIKIPVSNPQFPITHMRVDNWFEAKEIRDCKYLLTDIKGVAVGIFDSIDLDIEETDK